ncbi:MAG: hypothetical protein Q4B43_11185 [Bacteroidota bacterium]|nr:hypothetical protein [Bacteroidota bacterium]
MNTFLSFKNRWEKMPLQEKIKIAIQTDSLNNQGSFCHNSGDVTTAIQYFEKALEVMPINDDALSNLIKCYKKTKLYSKIPTLLKKLYIINPSNVLRQKMIAFTLISLIIENYESEHDIGIVGVSEIINTVEKFYEIHISDEDIMLVYDKINKSYSADILSWGTKPEGIFSSSYEKFYRSESNIPRSLLKNELNDILN